MLSAIFEVNRSILKGNYACCSPAPLNQIDTAFNQNIISILKENSVIPVKDICLS